MRLTEVKVLGKWRRALFLNVLSNCFVCDVPVDAEQPTATETKSSHEQTELQRQRTVDDKIKNSSMAKICRGLNVFQSI